MGTPVPTALGGLAVFTLYELLVFVVIVNLPDPSRDRTSGVRLFSSHGGNAPAWSVVDTPR